jgi:biopolymer transport protein ExbD
MAKTSVYRRGGTGDVSFNMTPMIDVTFQLMLFFLLTSQAASSEIVVGVKLPEPVEPQVLQENEQAREKVVINVVSGREEGGGAEAATKAKAVVILGEHYDPLQTDEIKAHIERLYEDSANKDRFHAEIRADKDVYFEYVAPVMMVASQLGITKLNIVARPARGG